MTNADRLRNFSDEDLAELLHLTSLGLIPKVIEESSDKQAAWFEWIKQEANGDR